MNSDSFHLPASWLAVFAYVLHIAVVVAGFVQCETPQGEIVFEAGCEHAHCASSSASVAPYQAPYSLSSAHHPEHAGHQDNDEWDACSECACEDVPLDVENATRTARRPSDGVVASPETGALQVLIPNNGPGFARLARQSHLPSDRPPPIDKTHLALRTIVLLI